MTRKDRGKRTFLASLGLSLLTGLAACSGASTGTPDPGATGDDGSGSGSRSSSGSSASSGEASGSGAGASTGSTSGSSSGSPSGSRSGSAGDGGTTGAMDLAPPATADGIQIATPAYDANDPNAKQLVVPAGGEIFLCYYVTLPNAAEIDVGAFQSFMTQGSSHHFILYQNNGPSALLAGTEPSGSIVSNCPAGAGTWVYATSTPGKVVGMTMPAGVGLPFAAGTQVMMNLHFINSSTKAVYPAAKLNLLYAKNIQYKAAAMVSFNTKISIPPQSGSTPGQQTVGGTCTGIPAGSQFFTMSTHSHEWARSVTIRYVHNGQSTEVVHTSSANDPAPSTPVDQEPGTGTDFEHPGVAQWTAPDFLKTSVGDTFQYACAYENTTDKPIVVGNSAFKNEMCMAIGYYFPAPTSALSAPSCDSNYSP